MYTFIIQTLDLIYLNQVGLFWVFFIVLWGLHFHKIFRASKYKEPRGDGSKFSLSIIVPVADEPDQIWATVIQALKGEIKNRDAEIIVVANGPKCEHNAVYAQEQGLKVIRQSEGNKRLAILEASKIASKELCIILDSDTVATKGSVTKLLAAFSNPEVGGATGKHIVFNREPFVRRVSDWLEDVRFYYSVRAQSVKGAVSCLPGRMFALRTHLLKEAAPELYNQTFLGKRCLSGDDRFITSWLLRRGWKTVYMESSLVYTDAPNTIKGFAKQRLRWTRSNFRESLLSIPWVGKYPFTAITVISPWILKAMFGYTLLTAGLDWAGLIQGNHHYVFEHYPFMQAMGVAISGFIFGFVSGGMVRHFGHFMRYPQDLIFFVPFIFFTTLILVPVEWWAMLTHYKSDWMTRNVKAIEPRKGWLPAWLTSPVKIHSRNY